MVDRRYGKSRGMVYLVGAGPGDPGLLTIKAAEAISTADVIVYDYLAGQSFIEKARTDAELIYVGKTGKVHSVEQIDINQLLVSKAMEGKVVVRLKGGDPYVFGRGGEEAEELAFAGIPFELIPGITSAIAAPAYAGIPVTHRDHASSVTFVTGHEDPTKDQSCIDWSVLARTPGTLVFLMGVKNIDNISGELIAHGMSPDTPAAIVRWGTTPRQVSLASDLERIPAECKKKGISAPAVLVVGSVVKLRDSLSWYESKPLFGKKIVVTRSKIQSVRMADQIRKHGGEPILFPTIETVDPVDFGPLDRAFNTISNYDWVLFTSENGVERFFKRFFEIEKDIRDLAGPKFGAIGPITAKAIVLKGIKVDMLAKEFQAEGILEFFDNQDLDGKNILIPRAEKARDTLPDGLARKGARVDIVPVYRTIRPSGEDIATVRDLFLSKSVDAVTFTSSSTVDHFLEMMNVTDPVELLRGAVVASIGPITTDTLVKSGISPSVQAIKFTIDGLIEALVAHYELLTAN